MKSTYIFDACALIALLSKENGYKKVEEIINAAKNNQAKIVMHSLNLYEVYYNIYKTYSKDAALKFLNEMENSPIELNAEISKEIIAIAGNLKITYKMSLADSIGLAQACILHGTFVTADHHELDVVAKNEEINFTWIR